MSEGTSTKSLRLRAVKYFYSREAIFVFVLTVLFVALAALTLGQRSTGVTTTEAIGVIFLLLLPLFAQGAHLLRWPRDPIDGCIPGWCAVCVIYVAWLIEWSQPAWFNRFWLPAAWALLVCSAVLVYSTYHVTRNLMARTKEGEGARRHPLLALVYFLGLFLTVTYLLSFALLFAHRAEPRQHLRVTAPAPEPVIVVPASMAPASGAETASITAALPTSIRWRIFFDESSSVIPDAEGVNQNGHSDQVPTDRDAFLARWNGVCLEQVAAAVRERLPGHRVRIALVGRSSDTLVQNTSDLTRDNQELSRLRATYVAHRLLDLLDGEVAPPDLAPTNGDRSGEVRWDRIDWMYLPLSNTDHSPPDSHRIRMPNEPLTRLLGRYEPSPKSSVDILVSALPLDPPCANALVPRALSLLDFLYFTIYTITTTGYGDIVPISPFAKLVSSLANLYELFFLVIFFNVLLVSVRGSAETGGSES